VGERGGYGSFTKQCDASSLLRKWLTVTNTTPAHAERRFKAENVPVHLSVVDVFAHPEAYDESEDIQLLLSMGPNPQPTHYQLVVWFERRIADRELQGPQVLHCNDNIVPIAPLGSEEALRLLENAGMHKNHWDDMYAEPVQDILVGVDIPYARVWLEPFWLSHKFLNVFSHVPYVTRQRTMLLCVAKDDCSTTNHPTPPSSPTPAATSTPVAANTTDGRAGKEEEEEKEEKEDEPTSNVEIEVVDVTPAADEPVTTVDPELEPELNVPHASTFMTEKDISARFDVVDKVLVWEHFINDGEKWFNPSGIAVFQSSNNPSKLWFDYAPSGSCQNLCTVRCRKCRED
jgi:hypothetical protein